MVAINRGRGLLRKRADDPAPPGKPAVPEPSSPPISDGMLLVIAVALVLALVLGYLFLSKLADISREEDCMLAHRKTCGAVALPDR